MDLREVPDPVVQLLATVIRRCVGVSIVLAVSRGYPGRFAAVLLSALWARETLTGKWMLFC